MTAVCRHALFALLIPLLAGCLQAETTVRVTPDGSGTLIERVVLGHDTIALLTEMAPEDKPFTLLDEAWLRDQAGRYGEEVRLVAAMPLETDFGKGYEARYAFPDVNDLRVDTDPGTRVPGDDAGAAVEQEKAPELATFTLEPGSPARLVIRWPVDRPEADDGAASGAESGEEPAGEPAPEELAMLKEMLGGLRMSIAVEVEGEIVETNATHREGSRVTLLDIAFAELLSNEAALRKMATQEPETLAELKAFTKELPGLKLEVEPEVTVRFQ